MIDTAGVAGAAPEPVAAVDLYEHGGLVLRVLTELRPQTVCCIAPDPRFAARLDEYAGAVGATLTGDPSAAQLVICAAGDYGSVRSVLRGLDRPARPVIVGGTGWPCGRRDARATLDGVDALERGRFAFRLPVPGQIVLGTYASPIAFATAEGGSGNGVRTAVEDACRDAPGAWEVRVFHGFGGVAVLLPESVATPEAWARIDPPDAGDALLARLDAANAALRLDRERLIRETGPAFTNLSAAEGVLVRIEERLGLSAAGSATDSDPALGLAQRLSALDRELNAATARDEARAQARERALAAVQAGHADLSQWLREERAAGEGKDVVIASLTEELAGLNRQSERRAQAHDDELDRLAAAYEEERAFVLAEITRIAKSGTWRWGHRLAIARSRLLGRRTLGTDAVSRVMDRVSAPPLLPPPRQAPDGDGALPAAGQTTEPGRA